MDNIFGIRLKELREEHELTMDYVVFDMQHKYNIKINKGQLSRWENGQSPSLRCLKLLAMYYNVSADYLLGLTDSKKPSPRINMLREILTSEHSTEINVQEVREIIDKAMENADKKTLKRAFDLLYEHKQQEQPKQA